MARFVDQSKYGLRKRLKEWVGLNELRLCFTSGSVGASLMMAEILNTVQGSGLVVDEIKQIYTQAFYNYT